MAVDVGSQWIHLLVQLPHDSVMKDRTRRGDLQNHRPRIRAPCPGSTIHAYKKRKTLCPLTQSILPEGEEPSSTFSTFLPVDLILWKEDQVRPTSSSSSPCQFLLVYFFWANQVFSFEMVFPPLILLTISSGSFHTPPDPDYGHASPGFFWKLPTCLSPPPRVVSCGRPHPA